MSSTKSENNEEENVYMRQVYNYDILTDTNKNIARFSYYPCWLKDRLLYVPTPDYDILPGHDGSYHARIRNEQTDIYNKGDDETLWAAKI